MNQVHPGLAASRNLANGSPEDSPALDVAERWGVPAIGLYTLVVLGVTVFLHQTPLYLVETDLLGQFIPAARELAAGVLVPAHFTYHGVGYPLLLAGLAPLCGGDSYLAARVLSALAAGGAAWLAWLLVRLIAGRTVALFALAGLLVNPTFLRYAVEAGTDAPALAASLPPRTACCDRPRARASSSPGSRRGSRRSRATTPPS